MNPQDVLPDFNWKLTHRSPIDDKHSIAVWTSEKNTNIRQFIPQYKKAGRWTSYKVNGKVVARSNYGEAKRHIDRNK